MSDEQVEAIDHYEVAVARTDRVTGMAVDDARVSGEIALAQVAATLAVAEQLKQLRERMFPDPGEPHAEVWK